MVYPVLLLLMRTSRLLVVDWTDAHADLNGHVLFAERRNLVPARVPLHFKRCVLFSVLTSPLTNDPPFPQYRAPSPLQILHALAISHKSFPQPVSVTQISEIHTKVRDVWTNDSLVEGRLLILEIKNWQQINIRIWFKFYIDMHYIASQVYVMQNELWISTIFTTPPSSCKLSDKNHRTA